MKVALVTHELGENGGIERLVLDFIDYFKSNSDIEVKLITLATSANDSCSRRVLAPNTWFRSIQKEKRIWKDISTTHFGSNFCEVEYFRFQPRNILDNYLSDFDVIFMLTGFGAWGNVLSKLDHPMKIIWFASLSCLERQHLNPLNSIKDFLKYIHKPYLFAIEKKLKNYFQSVLTMNTGVTELINTTGIVFPGVELRDIILPKSSHGDYLLCVGRLSDSRKNVHFLIDVLNELKNKYKTHLYLKLAGATSPDEKFWSKVRASHLEEFVEFESLPSDKRLQELYTNALAFCLPSTEEGFGIVLLESMMSGTVAISTKSGGPEMIIKDMETGYLVDHEDLNTFAKRVYDLYTDNELNNKIAQQAYEDVQNCFLKARTFEAFKNIWNKNG